jgi:hypothetical protein
MHLVKSLLRPCSGYGMTTENVPTTLSLIDGMLRLDVLVAARNGEDLLLEYRERRVIGFLLWLVAAKASAGAIRASRPYIIEL